MLSRVKARLKRQPVNTSRIRLREFAREAGAVGSDRSFKVLDAGGGKMPYRNEFAKVTYDAADVTDHGQKYVCDIADMPIPDGEYDLVFCSQTLEHVTDPVRALREIRRVLRPGGEAWLTAPFFYEEHMTPWDYFRYTKYAWSQMAADAGFEVEEIDWLEGYYGTLSYQLQVAYRSLPRDMRWWRFLLLHLSRKLADRELKERYTRRGHCKNYRVRLRKPVAVLAT